MSYGSGYGGPPPGYSSAPPGYSAGYPAAYGAPPAGYGAPPAGYGAPPAGYGAPPGAYYGAAPGAAPGYGRPPATNPWQTAGWAPRDPASWALFQTVDTDRSGSVGLRELQNALGRGAWSSLPRKTSRMLFIMYDTDRSERKEYVW
jgi:hypothetical protein